MRPAICDSGAAYLFAGRHGARGIDLPFACFAHFASGLFDFSSLLFCFCLRIWYLISLGREQRPAAKQSLVSVAGGDCGLHFAELSALFGLGRLCRGALFGLGCLSCGALLCFPHFRWTRQGEEGQLLILRVFEAGGADADEAQGLPLREQTVFALEQSKKELRSAALEIRGFIARKVEALLSRVVLKGGCLCDNRERLGAYICLFEARGEFFRESPEERWEFAPHIGAVNVNGGGLLDGMAFCPGALAPHLGAAKPPRAVVDSLTGARPQNALQDIAGCRGGFAYRVNAEAEQFFGTPTADLARSLFSLMPTLTVKPRVSRISV